jgi:hypothetical protein
VSPELAKAILAYRDAASDRVDARTAVVRAKKAEQRSLERWAASQRVERRAFQALLGMLSGCDE